MLYKTAYRCLLKKIFGIFLFSFLFLFLLTCPQIALEASRQGLILWFDTLVPTLLPFLVLSQLILETNLSNIFERILAPFFQKLFHCSKEGAFCALCGFLCGYPIGARLISLKIKEEHLSVSEGQYLLSFCNQVSPMFCISYGIQKGIGSQQLFPYLLLIYGSAFFFGVLTRPKISENPVKILKKQTSSPKNLFQVIDVCIIDSFLILIKLCGYLVLFSIFNRCISLLLPEPVSLVFSIVLEITNGISLISTLPLGMLRTLLGVFCLSFGGVCCLFQTNSVIAQSGLSFRQYCTHKLLNGLVTLLLCCFFFLCSFAINSWS